MRQNLSFAKNKWITTEPEVLFTKLLLIVNLFESRSDISEILFGHYRKFVPIIVVRFQILDIIYYF
jgi:hypothetical protein